MTEEPDALIQIYQIVDQLLAAYDRSPTIHTVAPFVTLLRVWRDALNRLLDAQGDGDSLPGNGVSS